MVLRDYFNAFFLVFYMWSFSSAQTTAIRCINPEFDKLVDNYLNYSIPVISVADAIESKNYYIFLDARELNEFNTSHIENAIHIGYDNFRIEALNADIPKDKKIIIYCSIGYRSEKVGETLKQNGYQNVYNLYGSIFEWVNQHHPIVDKRGKPTLRLHTYNKKWSKWIEDEDIEKIW